MSKKESEKAKHEYDESVENFLTGMVIDDEIASAESNQKENNQTYEDVIEMFAKDYDWYSNLSLKEATSIILTDVSTAVNQYFQTRDFVEVVNNGERPDDVKKCRAAKKAINKTLNNRRLNHYQKFTRSKTINNLASHVYAVCQWNQDIERNQVGTRQFWQEGTDEEGNPTWVPASEPIIKETIKVDRFDYDVIDPRNSWASDEYTYSIQQKKWFAYRTEKSYEDLKGGAKANGYINLDIVKELQSTKAEDTEANKVLKKKTTQPKKTPSKLMDVYTRMGGIWAIVKERRNVTTLNGIVSVPSKIEPGYDAEGNVLDEAEYIKESIITIVSVNGNKVIIRFDATPYIDSSGNPFKPVLKGLCYPHPTKDTGLGDGELLLDFDMATNDAFNLAFDRAKLKTIPTMIGEKMAIEDNDSIFIAPGHTIAVEGGAKSLEMFKDVGDVQEIMQMLATIFNKTEQVTATYPTTMGNVGAVSPSTTATAIVGAENRTYLRGSFKGLTFEYTFQIEMYWMILQMIFRFARPETAIKLMGEDVYFFDPDGDYAYSPVTSSVETEFNKFRKLQMLQQMMATVAQVPNPNTPVIMNKLLIMVYQLLGPDYMEIEKTLLDTSKPSQLASMGMLESMGGNAGAGENMAGSLPSIGNPTSNQTGNPQTMGEMDARGRMGGMFQ
jgi:hypothetical protein